MEGCCNDKSCTESTCMKLPAGKTCGDCANFSRCAGLFQCPQSSTVCDFFPRRFVEQPADLRDARIADIEAQLAAARAENERLAGNRDLLVDEATDMQADIEGYLKELAALRAQRDAAIRERDDARWELCEDLAAWAQEFNNISPDPSVHAAARGWSYLYDKDGGR
jgi:hypothetical protein